MPKHQIIKAPSGATCPLCGKAYQAGTRILMDEKLGLVEADCYFNKLKDKKAQPSPAQPASLPNADSTEVRIYSSLEEANEKERARIVRLRLALAKKAISEELELPEAEIHQDSALLVEFMRELSSEKWFYKPS
jgi:hypothetical protein